MAKNENGKYHNSLPPGTLLRGVTYSYKIIKVLGQGTFGITYLATVRSDGGFDLDGTQVAIKEFFMSDINGRDTFTVTSSNRDGLFDKYKRKFVKEAQNLERLKHKNIIHVLEEFEANNTVYYAMTFMEGGSLDEYISRKGRLTEQETLKITGHIIDALTYMHSMRMLHLDLKPLNIMMQYGEPVLIDFGLSKQYDNEGRPESSTTVGGGTPGYSPIEQTNYTGELKENKQLPVQMDMYALGATMYAMLTGKHPPLAADILNYGFPDADLRQLGISVHTHNVVKQLMSPVWQDRPANDRALKQMISSPQTPQQPVRRTVPHASAPHATVQKVTPQFPQSNNNSNSKLKQYLVYAVVALLAIGVAIGGVALYRHNKDSKPAEKSQPAPVAVADGPAIEYKVTGDDPNTQLVAVVNGEEMVIGSINYIFGNDNFGKMEVFAQEDFNGDGVKEALVSDSNIGNAGGTTWAFITYKGDGSFEKSNLFSEASYYEPEITTVDGQKVLDFISTDMGQRIVRERHGLRNGNAVSLDLPKTSSQAYTPLKTVNMDDLGEDGEFSFDINDDGSSERIKTTGSYHFGRAFEMQLNGTLYDFSVSANWGAGTLYILKSTTQGLHDLMVEDGSGIRQIYKWDGATYTEA